VIEWLNDNSSAVQAISVVVLAVVTTIYAIATLKISNATKRQAEASVKMAEELVESRHGDVLPLLDFYTLEGKSGYEILTKLFRIQAGALPETFHGRIKNIGYGPALDVKFLTKLDDMEPGWQSVHRVEKGEYAFRELEPSPDWYIYLEPTNDLVKRLRVEYHNVYGRAYISWREVTFDRETGSTKVGHLHTEPEKTS